MPIVLIIWAVIAIAGFFTAAEIVDETTNSSDEQKALIDSTAKFCSDNNLSPADCKALMTQNTAAVDQGGFFSGLQNLALWGLGAVFVWKVVIPQFTDKKTSTT